jgi:hypothetical protein
MLSEWRFDLSNPIMYNSIKMVSGSVPMNRGRQYCLRTVRNGYVLATSQITFPGKGLMTRVRLEALSSFPFFACRNKSME